MGRVYFNGAIAERKDVRIDLEDRGYQFGDGIYEVIRVYGGKSFLMEEHLARLQRSARSLSIALPFDLGTFADHLARLAEDDGIGDGTIYVQVTRGVAKRSHQFPKVSTQPIVIAYTDEFPRPRKLIAEGAACVLTEDIRWLKCDIKSTNLLGNVLAKEEAKSKGAYEAILHRGDIVTEGASSNIFALRSGVLFTHPENNLILNGITRTAVLGIVSRLGLPLKEEAVTVDALLASDEVFLTSTTSEVMAVTKIGEKTVGTGKPGPVAQRLEIEFEKLIAESQKR